MAASPAVSDHHQLIHLVYMPAGQEAAPMTEAVPLLPCLTVRVYGMEKKQVMIFTLHFILTAVCSIALFNQILKYPRDRATTRNPSLVGGYSTAY